MKHLLRLFCMVLIFSSLTLFCCSADVLSDYVTPEIYNDPDAMATFQDEIPQEVQDAVKAQDPALNAFGEMTAYFEKDKFGCSIRPEGYAGEYIREDNILVIMVQHPTAFMETEAYQSITDKSVVEVVEVKNDYQELEELRWIANELHENGYHLVSDGVDIKNNVYLITMLADDFDALMENGYIEKMSSEYPVIFDVEEYGVTVRTN